MSPERRSAAMGHRTKRCAGLVLISGLFGPAQAQAPSSEPWPSPDPSSLQAGAYKDAVLYGKKLFNETSAVLGPEVPDKSMRYSGNKLSCESCHLQSGTQRFALPMIGVFGAFPTYMAREDEVRTIEERIEGCMERSMSGRALPLGGKEMKALVAYIQFLSAGVPVGKNIEGRGSPAMPFLTRAANPEQGAKVYQRDCAVCHQADGQSKRNGLAGDAKGYLYPPLWGPDSFNDGAGMYRLIASATFIRANMPFGTQYSKPVLSVEDAWDVAAYINSQPRPHRDNLEADYPNRARKPVDAPFPPFVDHFPVDQHKYGPFQPILEAQRASASATR
jgi:thiosulfate dehydrogenase